MLLNLLQNARNHTKHGVVTVGVKNNEAVILTVEDTREGIPSELLPRMFERGVSGGEGSGIGLVVCKEIIASHGGTIEITSKAVLDNNLYNIVSKTPTAVDISETKSTTNYQAMPKTNTGTVVIVSFPVYKDGDING